MDDGSTLSEAVASYRKQSAPVHDDQSSSPSGKVGRVGTVTGVDVASGATGELEVS